MPAIDIQQAPANIEATSDKIGAVNVLGSNNPMESKGLYDESEFDKAKNKNNFRQFNNACDRVRNFHAQQHTLQTVAYNLKARNDFYNKTRAHMNIWEAMEKLNTFIDECDSDTQESQMTHLLQSAEAIRQEGMPR